VYIRFQNILVPIYVLIFQVLQLHILPHNRFTVTCDVSVARKEDALKVLANLHRKRLGGKRILVMISANEQISLNLFKYVRILKFCTYSTLILFYKKFWTKYKNFVQCSCPCPLTSFTRGDGKHLDFLRWVTATFARIILFISSAKERTKKQTCRRNKSANCRKTLIKMDRRHSKSSGKSSAADRIGGEGKKFWREA